MQKVKILQKVKTQCVIVSFLNTSLCMRFGLRFTFELCSLWLLNCLLVLCPSPVPHLYIPTVSVFKPKHTTEMKEELFHSGGKWPVFERTVDSMLLDCMLQSMLLRNQAPKPFKHLRKQLVPLCWETKGMSWGRAEQPQLCDSYRHPVPFRGAGMYGL